MRKETIFLFVFGIANLGLVLYGFLALLNPSVLLNSFSTYVFQFPEATKAAESYLAALYRLLGFFNLLAGAIGLLLLWRYRIAKQLWVLRTVMVASLLAYLAPVVFDNTVGHIGVFEVIEHILFAAMILSGLSMASVWSKAE